MSDFRFWNTQKDPPETLVTFKTFDQSDKKTWPDQQKGKYIDKNNDKDKYI